MAASEATHAPLSGLIERATSKLLEQIDWDINLQIAEICAVDPDKSQEAVALLRKRLNRSKLSGGLSGALSSTPSANESRTLYAVVCLIGCLVKHAWFFLHCVHLSDLLHQLQKIASNRKTPLHIRDKIIRLIDVWGNGLQSSAEFPKFWMTAQSLQQSLGEAYHQVVQQQQEVKEYFELPIPPTQVQEPTLRYIISSSYHRPPAPVTIATEETIATRSYRIAKALPKYAADFKSCQDLVDVCDSFSIRDHCVLSELYPDCQYHHRQIVEWIEEGQISEPVFMQLIALNEQMLEINRAINTLTNGGTILLQEEEEQQQQQQQHDPVAGIGEEDSHDLIAAIEASTRSTDDHSPFLVSSPAAGKPDSEDDESSTTSYLDHHPLVKKSNR